MKKTKQSKQSKQIMLIGLTLIFLTVIQLSESKLIYLLEVSRHGAKYPSKNMIVSNDPPSLKGKLTGVGMRQHYLLGSYLHQDYLKKQQLISTKLNARQIQVFSSSYSRAIDSAYSQMYGLFPNSEGHIIPDGFNVNLLNPPFNVQNNLKNQQQPPKAVNYALNNGFQPPVVVVDDIIVNYCPNYGLFYTQRLKQISKNLTNFQGLHSLQISKMILAFNLSSLYATVPGMADLYDDIMSTIYLGRDLPSSFNDYDLKSLRFISDYYNLMLQASYFGQTLSTPLLKFMINKFNLVSQTQPQKKLTFFSCHAQNIFQLQAILNLTSIDCLTEKWNNKTVTSLNCMNTPDFASNLLFEIHQDQQTFNHQIKVKYNGEYAYLCEKKSTTCDLNQFISRISKYVKNDYQKQCGITNTQKQFYSQKQDINIINSKIEQVFI